MDEELFDFQLEGMEETEQLLVIEDGVRYHQKVTTLRRYQLEVDRQIEQGPETQRLNFKHAEQIVSSD